MKTTGFFSRRRFCATLALCAGTVLAGAVPAFARPAATWRAKKITELPEQESVAIMGFLFNQLDEKAIVRLHSARLTFIADVSYSVRGQTSLAKNQRVSLVLKSTRFGAPIPPRSEGVLNVFVSNNYKNIRDVEMLAIRVVTRSAGALPNAGKNAI